jgi:predicted Rossmann fold nucleotide-binding protein DprA/Smf involved in DNA uptake
MKIAVIGSRNLTVENLEKYIPEDADELVSGGARGIDSCVARFAKKHSIPLVEFLPDYARYGRAAPIKRNEEIARYADAAIAIWDGCSRGTSYTVRQFEKQGKPVTIIVFK